MKKKKRKLSMRPLVKMAPDWYKEDKMLRMSLSEAGTANRKHVPKITILSDDGIPMGPYTTCKDYLDDFVWAIKTGVASYECFGWRYKKGQPAPSLLHNLPLAVQFEKGSQYVGNLPSYLQNLRALFFNLETHLAVPKEEQTQFALLNNETIVLLLSLAWLKAIPTLSFACYLSRAGMVVPDGDIAKLRDAQMLLDRDKYYAQSGQKFIDKLMKDGFEGFESDWTKHEAAYNVHSDGFVSYSTRR